MIRMLDKKNIATYFITTKKKELPYPIDWFQFNPTMYVLENSILYIYICNVVKTDLFIYVSSVVVIRDHTVSI